MAFRRREEYKPFQGALQLSKVDITEFLEEGLGPFDLRVSKEPCSALKEITNHSSGNGQSSIPVATRFQGGSRGGRGSRGGQRARGGNAEKSRNSQNLIVIVPPLPPVFGNVPAYLGDDVALSSKLLKSFASLRDHFSSEAEKESVMLEQLNAMVNQSKIDMEKGIYSHAMGSYTQMENAICTSIFYWCQRFQVNVAVYFRSLELYDRFVVIQRKKIAEQLSLASADQTQKRETMKRLKMQFPLRICSCVSIASKLHGDCNSPAITLNQIQKALKERNHLFQLKSVMESELRVFKILEFRTQWVTPFDVLQLLVNFVDLPQQAMPDFYVGAVMHLKYTYINNSDFYGKIEESVKMSIDKDAFKRDFEYNAPLRAAVAVCATGHPVGTHFFNGTGKKLAHLINEPEKKVIEMAQLLYDMMPQSSTNSYSLQFGPCDP